MGDEGLDILGKTGLKWGTAHSVMGAGRAGGGLSAGPVRVVSSAQQRRQPLIRDSSADELRAALARRAWLPLFPKPLPTLRACLHVFLQDMYRALSGVRCPNLVRLHRCDGSSIRLQPDGETAVLHLAPVGLPLYGAPESEADLREAVRGVLAGVAALHAAGEAGKGRPRGGQEQHDAAAHAPRAHGGVVAAGSHMGTNTHVRRAALDAAVYSSMAVGLDDAAGADQRANGVCVVYVPLSCAVLLRRLPPTAGFVHRDIRWPNVIWLPPPLAAAAATTAASQQQPPAASASSATAAASSSSPAGAAGTYVLIDLEHAGAWASARAAVGQLHGQLHGLLSGAVGR
mgnify:CR=1 FL=1